MERLPLRLKQEIGIQSQGEKDFVPSILRKEKSEKEEQKLHKTLSMNESALEGWVLERLNLGISSKREKTNKKVRK